MKPTQNRVGTAIVAALGLLLPSQLIIAAEPAAPASQGNAVEPGSEAVQAGERIKSSRLSLKTTNDSPEEFLKQALIEQGFENGWDDTKQRWVNVTEIQVPIQPPVTAAKVVRVLNIANVMLYPKAAAQFASWLGMSNHYEANLSVGGSPVGRKFQDTQEKFQLQMDELEKKLAEAKTKVGKYRSLAEKQGVEASRRHEKMERDITEQQAIVEKLNRKAQFGPSTLEKLSIAGDALIKKIDTNYNAANFKKESSSSVDAAKTKLDELAAAKSQQDSDEMAEARSAYDSAQSEILTLVAQIKEKKAEAEEFLKNYTQTRFNQKYNYSADYDIVGLTPIKYSYGILSKEGGGVYLAAAAAFAWSPALERDTRAILHETGSDAQLAPYKERFRSSDLVAKRGEKSVTQWLNEQRGSMDTFGMGKWYVDNNGKRYWLGCAYAIKGGGSKADASLIGVQKDAERNLGLCLNFKLQMAGTKSDSMVYDEDDSSVESNLQELTKVVRSGLDISSEGLSGTFRMPLADGGESEPIRFYVAKTSADDVRAAHNAVLQQAESAARAHQARYEREGVRQAANESVRRSEEDRSPVARARGETSETLQTRNRGGGSRSDRAGGTPTATGSVSLQPSTNKVNKSGSVDTFIRVDQRKVPDDF